MAIFILRLLASVLSLALVATTSATAEPKVEMHRLGVNADDGSGWHPAVSTKGSFSVLMPVPFNDFMVGDAGADDTIHGIGGKSSEGIKFTAFEVRITAKTPVDLAAIPKTFSSKPANKVSDVSRNSRDDFDSLSFSVASSATTGHIRYIRTKDALYALTIESPNAHRDLAAEIKDRFFESFKLKGKS
jgi:hypothetical protein